MTDLYQISSIKLLLFFEIVTYSFQIGLLAANVLRQDLVDPNPAIRSTAVTTICSLPVLAQQDAVTGTLSNNTYVLL